MKLKSSILMMCMLFLLSGITHLSAQVSIGLDETPEKYATLQIKDVAIDKTAGPFDAATAKTGGLLLPRVGLTKKKELFPFITQTEIDADQAAYDKLKLLHTGLIVYNLTESDTEELCLGLNQWDGEQWNCFQEKIGNAIATVTDCSTIGFFGTYKDKESLTSSNYMTVKLNVTKAGAYTITARAGYSSDHNQDNGYYFTTTGVFMTTGTYELTVPGAGTPLLFTPDGEPGDLITITFNGKPLVDGTGTACPKYVIVENSAVKPAFRMDCGSSRVYGTYYMNKELTASEYIEVTLRVDPTSYPGGGSTPARGRLWTDEVNGIKFEGDILLENSTVTVKMMGEGTPNTVEPIKLTIYSNSVTTTAICEVTVRPVIKRKKVVSIANANGYGYGLSGALHHVSRMLGSNSYVNTANFGAATSTVPSEQPNYVRYSTGDADTEAEMRSIITTEVPDIIFIGFQHNPSETNSPGVAKILVEYVKAGGVLIAEWEQASGVYITQEFFRQIFNDNSIASNRVSTTGSSTYANGNVYRIENVDDEITNGPFGDVRGLQWGDDGANGIRVYGLPEDRIIRYSNDINLSSDNIDYVIEGACTFLRLKDYNMVFIGDGGFTAGSQNSGGDQSTFKSTEVFTISSDAAKRPIPNTQYGNPSGTKFTVYNSLMFGNLYAWALKQSEKYPYTP